MISGVMKIWLSGLCSSKVYIIFQIGERVVYRYLHQTDRDKLRQGRSYHWGLGARAPPPIGSPPPMILVTVQFIAISEILLLNGRFDSYANMYLYVLLYSFTYSLDKILTEVLITQFTQCM